MGDNHNKAATESTFFLGLILMLASSTPLLARFARYYASTATMSHNSSLQDSSICQNFSDLCSIAHGVYLREIGRTEADHLTIFVGMPYSGELRPQIAMNAA